MPLRAVQIFNHALIMINTPATSHAMINEILKEFPNQGVICYMNDILVYSVTIIENQLLLSKIMALLIKHGLAEDIEKCVCETSIVDFLSCVVSEKALEMSLEKGKNCNRV